MGKASLMTQGYRSACGSAAKRQAQRSSSEIREHDQLALGGLHPLSEGRWGIPGVHLDAAMCDDGTGIVLRDDQMHGRSRRAVARCEDRSMHVLTVHAGATELRK